MSVNSFACHGLLLFGLINSLLSYSAASVADEAPSVEFLEFLGQWETPDGEWIDPMALKELDAAEPVKLKAVDEEPKDEN